MGCISTSNRSAVGVISRQRGRRRLAGAPHARVLLLEVVPTGLHARKRRRPPARRRFAKSEYVTAVVRLVFAVLSCVTGIMDAHAALPCPGGRFLVTQLPFNIIAIVVEGAEVSVDGVCPSIIGRLKGSKRGTDIRATWPSCQALNGPAALKASIGAGDCTTMAGVFKGRVRLCFDGKCNVQRFRQPFSATRGD